MNDNRFFKYIWRINAVLVFICGGFLIWEFTKDFLPGSLFHRRSVAEEFVEDNTLRLSQPIAAGNGAFFVSTLSPGGRSQERGGWLDEPVRNFMVVDAKTNEARWLLPDTTRFIIRWNEITRDADCGLESIGLQLVCVEEDTNGDGLRNWRDELTRLVSAGFDHEPRDLFGEPVRSFWYSDSEDRLFCHFTTAAGLETAIFALDENMTLINRSVLPGLEALPKASSEGGDG